MRLEASSRTDLALRAIHHLADRGERVPRDVLAVELRTTPDFMARAIAPLVGQGWVESRPGRSGGYQIRDTARNITVLDVIEAMEGIPMDRCVLRSGPCEPDENCALHVPWTRARDALLAELASSPVLGNGGKHE